MEAYATTLDMSTEQLGNNKFLFLQCFIDKYSLYNFDINILICLLAAVDPLNSWKATPLYLAVLLGQISCVKHLLEYQACVDHLTEEKNSPLHCAVTIGHIDIVKLLLENSANVDLKNGYHKTPFEEAIANGNTDIVNLIETWKQSDQSDI